MAISANTVFTLVAAVGWVGCASATPTVAEGPASPTVSPERAAAPAPSTSAIPPAAPKVAAVAPPEPGMMWLPIPHLGVRLKVREGSRVTKTIEGDEVLKPGAQVDTQKDCGVMVDVFQHAAVDKDAWEDRVLGTDPKGKPVTFTVEERSATGYRFMRSWMHFGGPSWSVHTAHVSGEHLFLCSASRVGSLEQREAQCVLDVCASLSKVPRP
jgi:hypothetical protein